jgi:hypothetical protein
MVLSGERVGQWSVARVWGGGEGIKINQNFKIK